MISSREIKDVAKLAKDLGDLVKEKRVPKRVSGQKVSTAMAPFKGVSSVSAAPVSIGNTVRSVQPSITTAAGVTRVVGRDFIMPVQGIGAGFSNWAFSGGMPLTPAGLVASAIRGFFQSYQHYRFVKVDVHYISSSPTSLAGDVLMLWHANRGGPKVNHNSANFLSYALSTKNALLGPQWSNHTVSIVTDSVWRGTDILDSEDLTHQSDGELLVYTRATTNGSLADSPGYLVMDYVVDFKSLLTNPRILTLPSNLFKWTNVGLRGVAGGGSFSPAAGEVFRFTALSADNYVNSVLPLTGGTVGYIYQIVIDIDTNLYNPNGLNLNTIVSARMDALGATGTLAAYPLTTGTTLYLVQTVSTTFDVYPTYESAMAANPLVWSSALANINLGINSVLSLCGSTTAALSQSNIG